MSKDLKINIFNILNNISLCSY